MTKLINKAIKIRDKGTALKILLENRKYISDKIEKIDNLKYFSESDLSLDFLNKHGRTETLHIINRLTNVNYVRKSQILGKDICDELNNFNTKCINDLIDISKTHLQLKIEQIDLIIKRLT